MLFSLPGLAGVLSIVLSVVALPAENSYYAVKEEFQPPRGWTALRPAPSNHVIDLHVYLAQNDFPSLEESIYEISDPDHERYGQHLSKEEVDALVAPHPTTLDLVDEWLLAHEINLTTAQRSSSKDTVSFSVTVAKAEQMLKTQYMIWQHDTSGELLVRTTSYQLPTDLHAHIDLVQPTTVFSRIKSQRTFFKWEEAVPEAIDVTSQTTILANGQEVDLSCNTSITISCIKQLYNAVNVSASGTTENKIGITGYLNQSASHVDYSLFLANQTSLSPDLGFNVVFINGGKNNESAPGGEANLDTQFAFGLAAPSPATFWSTGGMPPFDPSVGTPSNTNEPYTEWINFVLSQKSIPQTISTSYGDDEQTVPKSFAIRVCAGFAQISARGSTLLFSSGDGGVGDGDPDPATQECQTNDGTNRTAFIPGFPASCPFVTAVGATIHVPEVAEGFSGGGFSNYFLRPLFQEEAVSTFLKKLPKGTYDGLFNPLGRGIPDVALQGVDFRIFIKAVNRGISGTSASSPGFAGLVSLINDQRLLNGEPSLGFLNPAIYKLPKDFNDITVGNNPGCGTLGFNATEGWDAVTGLGTPDVGKLIKSLVKCKK